MPGGIERLGDDARASSGSFASRPSGTENIYKIYDGNPGNTHLPHSYPVNTVCYTGTHDNPTTREWYADLPDLGGHNLWHYLKRPEGEICDAGPELIRLVWSSPAALAIAPLQDLLNLGGEARMNVPGRADGTWRWRATPQMLSAWNFQWLRDSNGSGTGLVSSVREGVINTAGASSAVTTPRQIEVT